jgi:NADH-quinone oxidoreductase subunit C
VSDSTEQAKSATRARVTAALAAAPAVTCGVEDSADGTVIVRVSPAELLMTLTRLHEGARFDAATFATAVDHHPVDAGAARFEVHHQLYSLTDGDRVRVSTEVAEDDAHVPSCVHLWPGAGFMERECFDMFGIVFDGNPDLRRLLMPDGFDHHPLRKDFPHHGIEPDRLYREWDAARRDEEQG